MNILERAIQIASEAHKGQYDKAGKDYVEHPLCVMEIDDEELRQMWADGKSVHEIAEYFGRDEPPLYRS